MPTKYDREYYLANKEKLNKKTREYYRRNLEKSKKSSRNRKLITNYGITIETYNEMFERQQGKCAVCGKHQSVLVEKLGVDHDHYTGKVRGLLCRKCNFGIGFLDDDILLLQRCMTYLFKTHG